MDAIATPTLRSELRRGVSPYNLGVAFVASLIIAAVEFGLSRAGVIPLVASSDFAQSIAAGGTLFVIISAMHIAAHAYFGWRFERGVAALSKGSMTRALELLEIADRKGMEHYDEQGAVRRLVAKIRAGDFAVLVLVTALFAVSAQAAVIDDFENVSGWRSVSSDGVDLRISQDAGRTGKAMRLDFDFRGGAGYAVARKEIDIAFPQPNYEISFWMRADAPVNNLELKFADASGENVWWINRHNFTFPRQWTEIRTRKRQISFAWGPAGGGELRRAAAVELAITAGSGGKGTVWLDDFTITPRDPVAPFDPSPIVTNWRGGEGGDAFRSDFGAGREMGGLVIEWDPSDYARDYVVELSDDGSRWDEVRRVTNGDGGRDFLHFPDREARYLRIAARRSSRGRGVAIRSAALLPVDLSVNDLFSRIAAEAPRGDYPSYLRGEQLYWTVIGADGDRDEALISENGAVEAFKGGFTLEPFVFDGEKLVTWSGPRVTQSLEKGYLPIPSVRWETDRFDLTTTAFVGGKAGASTLYIRYLLNEKHRLKPVLHTPALHVAVRPFQVNSSSQFLNNIGGVGTLRTLRWDGKELVADGKRVVPLTPPASFGAAAFDEGDIVTLLRDRNVTERPGVDDPIGYASGVLTFPARSEVWIAVPLHNESPVSSPNLQQVAGEWDAKLNRVRLSLPGNAKTYADTVRSNIAWILINRDGPSIQPGSRSYERSWIRDGALTSAALLRYGHEDAVRQFIEWYAPFQFASGKVPCCVDFRGADPVPENDSHGELVYLIAEYYRYTRDRVLLERMWPHVVRAVDYMDELRRQRMTPEYEKPEKRAYYGLLPESISHEGYSAKPMHSFWDQLFALKGLKDAAFIAEELGKEERVRFAKMRDEFRIAVMNAYQRTMENHKIDYLAGAVELGDFDATSTTVAVSPAGEARNLPPGALERTFDRYLRQFRARALGNNWDAYTPYEHRAVGTFVRLGRRDDAHEVLDFFWPHRRPPAWNHWAEVVFRDEDTVKFIGDMPHTWVGSDFIRSFSDMLAYEDEDGAIVVGAGVPLAWTESTGVEVGGLRTHYGKLDLTMRREPTGIRVRLGGDARPPRGFVIRSPYDGSERRVAAAPAEVLIPAKPEG